MQNSNQGKGQGAPKQSGLSWTQPAVSNTPKPATAEPKPVTASTKPTRIPMGSATRTLGVFAAGLVVGGLVMYAFTGGSDTTAVVRQTGQGDAMANTETHADSAMAGTGAVTGSGADLSLTVGGQPAGMQVLVSNVEVTVPTWVVVYDEAGGAPGKALGAAMFFPQNNNEAGIIPLLRPTVAGQGYVVGGRVDNGDHQFEPGVDSAIAQDDARVLFTFTAQ